MEPSKKLQTLTQVVEKLKGRGYSEEISMTDNNQIHSKDLSMDIPAHEFEIEKAYRFEGCTDPADEAVVYALSSPRYRFKAIMVDGYGPSSDPRKAKATQQMRRLHDVA